jgi:hypothetical protein
VRWNGENTPQKRGKQSFAQENDREVPCREHLYDAAFFSIACETVRRSSGIHLRRTTNMNAGTCATLLAHALPTKIPTNDSEEKNSARAVARIQARVQNFDPAGGGPLAQTGDHRVQQAAKSGKQKRTGEGDGHALMLEIGFTHRPGMGKEKPREHGQDPTYCGK